jgi:hypothetical protein
MGGMAYIARFDVKELQCTLAHTPDGQNLGVREQGEKSAQYSVSLVQLARTRTAI